MATLLAVAATMLFIAAEFVAMHFWWKLPAKWRTDRAKNTLLVATYASAFALAIVATALGYRH